jgi:hypothetical protein
MADLIYRQGYTADDALAAADRVLPKSLASHNRRAFASDLPQNLQ